MKESRNQDIERNRREVVERWSFRPFSVPGGENVLKLRSAIKILGSRLNWPRAKTLLLSRLGL